MFGIICKVLLVPLKSDTRTHIPLKIPAMLVQLGSQPKISHQTKTFRVNISKVCALILNPTFLNLPKSAKNISSFLFKPRFLR